MKFRIGMQNTFLWLYSESLECKTYGDAISISGGYNRQLGV